ncbi:hypothetical protein N752_05455 [Desulforamulus aquiferis]|nr:hypothetical protein N752_05455 [Desulforamulus aquiferis]
MPKVLVVDDEQPILELVKYNLEREGYEVLVASDGNAGITLARTENPDLIVLDVMLPGQDGLSVCRTLHQDKETRSIPIIMLSAGGRNWIRFLVWKWVLTTILPNPSAPGS